MAASARPRALAGPDSVPGLKLAVSSEPFGATGGDLFDAVRIDGPFEKQERWAIIIADASGRGAAGAAVIARVRTLFRTRAQRSTSAADLLWHLNEYLSRGAIESSFVTAFVGIYTPATGRFTYASAGHPPPLHASASGLRRLDSVGSYPLGIDGGRLFEEASVVLKPGDSLAFYTDGISEARDATGTMFGIQGLEQAFTSGGSSHEALEALRRTVSAHRRGVQATDDQTLAVATVERPSGVIAELGPARSADRAPATEPFRLRFAV